MHLINNQPILDLSSYVNIQTLLEIKPYLDYAVVKSSRIITPSRYSGNQFLNQQGIGITDILDSYSSEYPFIQDLKDNDQLASWLRYQFDVIYGQQSVQIIYPTSWQTKHLKESCLPTENVKYFKPFFDWLDKQEIFSQYGRVVVFTNEPGVDTPTHYDYRNDITSKDEFIWINLDLRKKFFVYDPETKIKHYLEGPVGTFNNHDYHGADPSKFATWSIRVDGTFSDSFLDKINLVNYFRL
jgi:hypothetical protein